MSEQKDEHPIIGEMEQLPEEFDAAYFNHAFDELYDNTLEELHPDLDEDWLKEYEANAEGVKICNIDNPDCESCT